MSTTTTGDSTKASKGSLIRPMRLGRNIRGLEELMEKLPRNLKMLEVGSYAGESAEIFMRTKKVRYLYCVDPWAGAEYEEAERMFDKKVAPFKQNVFKFKMSSLEVSFEKDFFDFIYIDANHAYEHVVRDIQKFLPMVRPGGWMGGHDYTGGFLGVVQAVYEVFGKPHYVFRDGSWLVKREK